MASPTPSKMLVTKNSKFHTISFDILSPPPGPVSKPGDMLFYAP